MCNNIVSKSKTITEPKPKPSQLTNTTTTTEQGQRQQQQKATQHNKTSACGVGVESRPWVILLSSFPLKPFTKIEFYILLQVWVGLLTPPKLYVECMGYGLELMSFHSYVNYVSLAVFSLSFFIFYFIFAILFCVGRVQLNRTNRQHSV